MIQRLRLPLFTAVLLGALPAAAALQINTPALSIGVPGIAYPNTPHITASGGTGGLTYTLQSGAVSGLTLVNYSGSEAFFNGTPTTAGFYPITVQVSDSATPTPATATRSHTVEIRASLSYFPPDAWEARGIFGGTLREIRPSPNYPTDGTIVAGGVAGELFITTNNGGNWTRRPVNPARLDADLHTVRLSPDYDRNGSTPSSATIFVASRDKGVSFAAAPGAPGTRLLSGLRMPSNFNAAGPPSGPGMVIASDGSGLWKSNGDPTAFTAVTNYKQLDDNQTAAAVGPVAAGSTQLALWVGTGDRGIYRSLGGGAAFDPYSAGLPAGAGVLALWVPSAAPAAPLASLGGDGIWRWVAAAGAWQRHASPAIAPAGNHPQFHEDETHLYAARRDGPSIRSSDGGRLGRP